MDIKCEEVWREISNYIDNDIDANLRAEMERHFAGCKHCSAVLDGTRNIVQIYGDERMFSVPAEFSPALQRRLAARLEPERSSKFTWLAVFGGRGPGRCVASDFQRTAIRVAEIARADERARVARAFGNGCSE